MRTKYITFNDLQFEIENVIIFSDFITHSDMANAMARLHAQPVSAGFIELTPDGPVCFGRSESLKLDSRPEIDTKLARRLFQIR